MLQQFQHIRSKYATANISRYAILILKHLILRFHNDFSIVIITFIDTPPPTIQPISLEII
jgi:hypothetical protein